MSGRKKRRPAAPRTEPVPAKADAPEEPPPRRQGLFGSALTSTGPSALPPIGRSLGRGMLAVAVQPVLIVGACLIVLGTWVALVALGFEGSPSRLVDLLAMPPVSTYFDLGTGATLYGIGPAFLVYLGVSLAVRTLVSSLLAGLVLEALEDGRVSRYGAIRGLIAMPTVLVVQVASLSLIVAGNLIFPILGPGIGFLGFVSALVAGLYFLGFAPTAAIREGRPVLDTIRRSARAAMLPGGRHLVLCSLYFFIALPVALGFAPGGTEVTANPALLTWVFVLSANVLHLGFAAAFAYRWVVAEPNVPDEPVRRRPATRPAPSRPRRR